MIKELITSGPVGSSLVFCRIAVKLGLRLAGRIPPASNNSLTNLLIEGYEDVKITNNKDRRRELSVKMSDALILIVRSRSNDAYINKYARLSEEYEIPSLLIDIDIAQHDIYHTRDLVAGFLKRNNVQKPLLEGVDINIKEKRMLIRLFCNIILNMNLIKSCFTCQFGVNPSSNCRVDSQDFPQVSCKHPDTLWEKKLRGVEQLCIHFKHKNL